MALPLSLTGTGIDAFLLRYPANADNISKEILQIQRYARAEGAAARVSAANGTGGGRAGADRALLAGVHDDPRRALDRAYTRDGPVWHGHLLHIHVLHDVHRRRVPVRRGVRPHV